MIRGTKRKGRPRGEGNDFILHHFTQRLKEGHSVAAIARAGVRLTNNLPESDPRSKETVRHLEGPSLERRYRELRDEEARLRDVARDISAREGTRYIGISRPASVSPFEHGQSLKRGRPRKSSTG